MTSDSTPDTDNQPTTAEECSTAETTNSISGVSRRNLLGAVGGLGVLTAGGYVSSNSSLAKSTSSAQTGSAGSDEESLATAAFYRFRIGEFTLTAISDGVLTFPSSFYGLNASSKALEQLLAANSLPTDTVTNQSIPLIVETDENTVLIDTGFGSFDPTSIPTDAGKLAPTMELLDIGFDEIDTVVLTHGHPDHIGGVVDGQGEPMFPEARHVMWEADWDYWTSVVAPYDSADDIAESNVSHRVAYETLLPLEEHDDVEVDLISNEDGIVPGIQAIEAGGHTPGHMALEVGSGDERLLHTADSAGHFLMALERPEWYGGFDLNPEEAIEVRRRLFDRAAADGVATFAYHFPFPGVGRVAANDDENNWKWIPANVQ